MSASEKLRGLAARFDDDYYGAADASAHALPLIADVVEAAERAADVAVTDYRRMGPLLRQEVAPALTALREHLEGQ